MTFRLHWHKGLLAALLILWSAVSAGTAVDADADGLPDEWEVQYGLDPSRATGADGAAGDPDQDGATNEQELQLGTHPRGFFARTFAEGATGAFFDARFAVFNPDDSRPSRVLVRYFTTEGPVIPQVLLLPAHTRITIDPEVLQGLENTAFSTEITSDTLVVADRTMRWDATGYGSHAETGVAGASTTWYFAEGATHSGFDLYFLMQNPSHRTVRVDVTYLLSSGAPVERRYSLAPNSRFNIRVNQEDPRLAAAEVSAVFLSDTPIVVERAMYLTQRGRVFDAGHASAGVPTPGTRWFLAEGATGDFFDLFVLIGNAESKAADVRITYLLPDGGTIVTSRQVPPKSRTTIWVDNEDARLAATAVSTIVETINGTPILVERAMWWPGAPATWSEAHAASGTTLTSSRWALAEGETGGPDRTATFILVSNSSASAGIVRVTLVFENGSTTTRDFPIAARARMTVDAAVHFPESAGSRYGTIVESAGTPLDLVVERAMYSDATGETWAAGTASVGTPLPASGSAPQPATVTITSRQYASEAGPAIGSFALMRSDTTGPLSVSYSVIGTATPSADFVPLTGAVTFAAGQAGVIVEVTPVDDTAVEPDETVVLTVSTSPSYVVGRSSTASVVIGDNDGLPVPGGVISAADASRFLSQATMGPTTAAIDELRATTYRAWIAAQMQAPVSSYQGYIDNQTRPLGYFGFMHEMWLQTAISGPDQLRQRVANALLEILVTSSYGLGGDLSLLSLPTYMDTLSRHAFGNYRTLIEEVTLNPAMGAYLSMLQNDKEDPETGRLPNENYARELLQLFSIGLYELNQDGSQRLNGRGDPIPTYGQKEILGFSKVFTGWTYNQQSEPFLFKDALPDWRRPMMPIAAHHSTAPKPLLGGVELPGALTPEEDLRLALDNVFQHPNVGPFIGYRLIQRLVTSNPSRAYVSRVAAVFNDNGAGVRGDLGAVVTAILLDPEARDPLVGDAPGAGHLKEPMLRVAHLLRAFNARSRSGLFGLWNLEDTIGQAAFKSPTVFNFFAPTYAAPGPIAAAQLVSPEFQIASQTTALLYANYVRALVFTGVEFDDKLGNADHVTLDLTDLAALASTPSALIDRLDLILFGAALSPELRQIVLDAVMQIPAAQPLKRAQTAVYLLATSPEFVVQK